MAVFLWPSCCTKLRLLAPSYHPDVPLDWKRFLFGYLEEGIIPKIVSGMELCDLWARSCGEGLLYMAVEEGAHKSEQECRALHLVSCAGTAGRENKIEHKAKSAKQDYKSPGR